MDIPTQTSLLEQGFEPDTTSKQDKVVSDLNHAYYDIPAAEKESGAVTEPKNQHIYHNNYITLDNGSVRKIPVLRATENENPLHVGALHTTSIPSGYFRVLSPILTMRYAAEAAVRVIFGGLQKHDEESGNLISKTISDIVDGYKNYKIKPLEEFVTRATQQIDGEITHESLEQVEGFQKAKDIARGLGKPTNAFSFVKKLVEHKVREDKIAGIEIQRSELRHQFDQLTNDNSDLQAQFAESVNIEKQLFDLSDKKTDLLRQGADYSGQINKGKDRLEHNMNRATFDTILGCASLFGTAFYANRVYQDIKKVYAETVAYELYEEGKYAKDITMGDIIRSDNKLVEESWNQYVVKNLWRFATDALFFTRAAANGLNAVLPDNVSHTLNLNYLETLPLGELMLGAKGLLLFTETTRKNTSMLDDLLNLVSNKLNPQHGLGEAIKPSELLDLYQKKQLNDDPSKMFRDATRHDVEDDAKWRQASVVFSRMADMMNQTYKYKHHIDIQESPVEQIEQQILAKYQYFALPKFLYLLGHDLIDISQPERTLTLAEIANQYSIQEVRSFLEEEKSGKSLYELLRERPVDLQKTFGADSTPEMIEISETARSFQRGVINKFLQEHPDIKELYDIIKAYEYSDLSQNLVKSDGSNASFAQVLEETQSLIDRSAISYDSSINFNNNNITTAPVTGNPANNIVNFQSSQKTSSQQIASEPFAALPKLSFYPADMSSLPKHSNDSHAEERPTTTIDNPQHKDMVMTKMLTNDRVI